MDSSIRNAVIIFRDGSNLTVTPVSNAFTSGRQQFTRIVLRDAEQAIFGIRETAVHMDLPLIQRFINESQFGIPNDNDLTSEQVDQSGEQS